MSVQPEEISGANSDRHVVHFYDDEAYFAEIGRVLCVALDQGHAAVAIGTPAHLEAIADALQSRGIDVFAARTSGQYVALDAAEMLSNFMVDDWPDDRRFNEVLGGLIAPLASRYSKVSIFGEMVALLWVADRKQAAIHLEKLWNDLARVHPFWLTCAYPISVFSGEADQTLFRDVCAQHCRVLHAESALSAASTPVNGAGVYQQHSQAKPAPRPRVTAK